MKTIVLRALLVAAIMAPTGASLAERTRPLPQIINGTAAEPHQFPWQVGLLDKTGRNYCGGSLVGPDWILTAAHCLFDSQTKKIKLPADVHINVPVDDDLKPGEGKRYDVAQFFPNPNYATDPTSDIALIHLVEKVDVPFAVPIALDPDGKAFLPSSRVVVSGWGRTDPKVPGPAPSLMYAPLVISDPFTCAKLDPTFDPKKQLCTIAATATDAGTCYGDSGGPLAAMTSSTPPTLGGVVNGGQAACAPGVNRYTDVLYFLPWITSTMTTLTTKY